MTEENRLERILFWPDRKGIGLKQVQAALAGKDASAPPTPRTLAGKSVAMQGLGALEFVLFGTDSEALAEPGDPYRCAYGAAIAGNLDDDRRAMLDAAWAGSGWLCRGNGPIRAATIALYRTDAEAVTELFDVFVHGLEMVRDVRLNGFLGETPASDKPKQALFWRSGDDGRLARRQSARHEGRCSTRPASASALPADCRLDRHSRSRFEFDNARRRARRRRTDRSPRSLADPEQARQARLFPARHVAACRNSSASSWPARSA